MLHYVIRRADDKEPLALVRINVKERGNMVIGFPRTGRFGPMAPIDRNGRHVYNLMIGNNKDVERALISFSGYMLEEVEQSEWETFNAFELFPVLKTAIVR